MEQLYGLNLTNLANVIRKKECTTYLALPNINAAADAVAPYISQMNVIRFLLSLPYSDDDFFPNDGEELKLDPFFSHSDSTKTKEANNLLNQRTQLSAEFRKTALSAKPEVITRNIKDRWLNSSTLTQRKNIWNELQSMLGCTDLGYYDTFKLKAFINIPFTEDGLRRLFYLCYSYCLQISTVPVAEEVPELVSNAMPALKDLADYDPHRRTFYRSKSTAIRLHVCLDGETHTFCDEFAVIQYIRENRLMIHHLEFRDDMLYLHCQTLPRDLTLFHLGDEDIDMAEQAVQSHLSEFRPKVAWGNRTLAEMLSNGLRTHIWSGWGYRTPSGKLAAYLDFKRRTDGDIELGIQLTAPDYRRMHLASSLVQLFMLMHMDACTVTGTYEENEGMRSVLVACGFEDHNFRDPKNGILTNRIRERINPETPEDPLSWTNSVYYAAPSLASRIWRKSLERLPEEPV